MDINEEICEEELVVSNIGASVIMKMTSILQYPSEYEIFYGNFFISFELGILEVKRT